LTDLISYLPPKTTKIIISQRATSIKSADKIIVLDKGEVVGLGRHEQLLETCDIYREIFMSQQKAPHEMQENNQEEEEV